MFSLFLQGLMTKIAFCLESHNKKKHESQGYNKEKGFPKWKILFQNYKFTLLISG